MAKTKSKPMNQGLGAAKVAKKDEFYTQYVDIQKEVEAYLEFDLDAFRGKIVYCNCDDPFESNFFKYFAANFNRLGLKKLISTSYDGSPVAGVQLTLDEYNRTNGKRQKPKAIAIEIEEVKDLNGDGATDIEDVRLFLEQNPHHRTNLAEGGDFRSSECVELLKQADIVVTNPPFSLFREYVALLVRHKKKLLIIGNTNSITYKEIFPLIKANKLWLGCTNFNVGMFFEVPDDWENFHHIDEQTGKKIARVSTSCWYTNIDHGRRHEPLSLMTMADNLRYSKNLKGKSAYDRYDNYDAIEIGFYKDIPSDYDGIMGVPITFINKYNPDQFEIVGTTESNDPDNPFRTRVYTSKECRDAYQKRFGKSGVYDLNASGVVNGVKVFKRVLIRRCCRTVQGKKL
ncbi:adenine-specific methyltransferase EcoRI family protein [Sphingorhabdus sp. Alg239-R122]|uniref:adenine-specific methyltransferase EcoRI family protein n=1 Tax=Sphingorhabdus sp. Alg239-R122 TaxID=2305989 RepID=UPI00196717E0|nr:adenine-specific methyltransferase EcoRI family protein [Sphingorhabdus sp. Alg239-R122]